VERIIGSIVGWAVGAVIGAVVAVWRGVATRVWAALAARRPVVDPHIERLTWWRSAVGFVLVIACAVMGVAMTAWAWLMPLTYRLGEWQALAVPLMLIANLLLLLVIVATVVSGSRAIVRDRFRARDAHPAMGALVIAALSVWTLVIGFVEVTGPGFGQTPLPLWAAVSLLIVGPIVNLALSAYELVRLHRRFGITLRAVP
jgi:hypothetical protein